MPRRDEVIEVEVSDDGEVEWRCARVNRRLFATGEFSAVVCHPDGTPDEAFVETFRLDAEGGEWRRRHAPELSDVSA